MLLRVKVNITWALPLSQGNSHLKQTGIPQNPFDNVLQANSVT